MYLDGPFISHISQRIFRCTLQMFFVTSQLLIARNGRMLLME